MGFAPGEDATTVMAGEYRLRLVLAASGRAPDGGSMLYHPGCLVDSAEGHRREAERRGMEIVVGFVGPSFGYGGGRNKAMVGEVGSGTLRPWPT